MKISEVISLLKAGYTKKEIDELRTSETATIETVNTPEMVSEKPEEAPPAAATAAAAPPVQDNTEVLKAIENLTRVIQAQNIRGDSFEPVKKDNAVDILGSIINSQTK